MRLLWRGLVWSLVRRWRSHWLLIGGWRGNSLPAYFGGPWRHHSVVRLRRYDSLLRLAGSQPDCLRLLLRILLELHLARDCRTGRDRRNWRSARKLILGARADSRRLLTARNLRAGHRHLETKLHRPLFCAI